MAESELNRMVKAQAIVEDPYDICATKAECAALAQRFALQDVQALRAVLTLTPDGGGITASGPLTASWVQSCAVSGNDLPVAHREHLFLRFVPARTDRLPDEEVELTCDECDELEYSGDSFDLGEAVAQSLGLAIDPYATGPDADHLRAEKGLLDAASNSPFATLAALKK